MYDGSSRDRIAAFKVTFDRGMRPVRERPEDTHVTAVPAGT
jgi:hypothetical protein